MVEVVIAVAYLAACGSLGWYLGPKVYALLQKRKAMKEKYEKWS